ncbi:MAG: cyclase family protein [Oscillochloris sp.]|nr:cyclase family protein [Oscillochloris sp.]
MPNEPIIKIGRAPDGSVRQLQIGVHTGTLLRIAAAANSNPISIDQLSPRELVLPAIVIDVRDQAQDNPGYRLSTADIRNWERQHGNIPQGALVLLVTGWDTRWGDSTTYLNLDDSNIAQTPTFGNEATKLLADRGVAGLGIDAPDPGYTPINGYQLLLENLTSLEQLPASGATVIIGALKLQAAQSSPARVIALIP